MSRPSPFGVIGTAVDFEVRDDGGSMSFLGRLVNLNWKHDGHVVSEWSDSFVAEISIDKDHTITVRADRDDYEALVQLGQTEGV